MRDDATFEYTYSDPIKFDFEIPDFGRRPKRPEDKLPKKYRKGWK